MSRKLNNKYFAFIFIALFALTGCSVRIPRDIIPEKQMEDILYDYQLAKAIGEDMGGHEAYKRTLYVEYVFKKHNITEEQFDKSLAWYTRNTSMLTKIYERVSARYKAQNDEITNLIAIRDNKPKTSLPGDSIDVWVWDRLYRLSGSPLTNQITFTMPSDSNFMARDTISWEVDLHYLENNPDSAQAAIMSMLIQYENDSIIDEFKRLYESGHHVIRLQSDTLGTIKDIKGYIHYPVQRDTIKNILVTNVSLFRYHSRDSLALPTDSIAASEADTVNNVQPVPVVAVEAISETVTEAPVNQPNSDRASRLRTNRVDAVIRE